MALAACGALAKTPPPPLPRVGGGGGAAALLAGARDAAARATSDLLARAGSATSG